jgi:hypothetical protein
LRFASPNTRPPPARRSSASLPDVRRAGPGPEPHPAPAQPFALAEPPPTSRLSPQCLNSNGTHTSAPLMATGSIICLSIISPAIGPPGHATGYAPGMPIKAPGICEKNGRRSRRHEDCRDRAAQDLVPHKISAIPRTTVSFRRKSASRRLVTSIITSCGCRPV